MPGPEIYRDLYVPDLAEPALQCQGQKVTPVLMLTAWDQLHNNVLTIRDSGAVIPDAARAKQFDRDFTTKETGRGMGLHIVKRICDQCGWQIEIDSQSDSGTSVRVDFDVFPRS